jgi:hypothetical protein
MINLIYTILPIIALMIGFYFGYKIGKDKEIPKVELNPVKVIAKNVEDKREREQAKKDAEEIDTYLSNLDNYPNNQIRFKE